MKTKEWEFAKTRRKLIRMVERYKNRNKNIVYPRAEDIVDCICVAAWEYNESKRKCH